MKTNNLFKNSTILSLILFVIVFILLICFYPKNISLWVGYPIGYIILVTLSVLGRLITKKVGEEAPNKLVLVTSATYLVKILLIGALAFILYKIGMSVIPFCIGAVLYPLSINLCALILRGKNA